MASRCGTRIRSSYSQTPGETFTGQPGTVTKRAHWFINGSLIRWRASLGQLRSRSHDRGGTDAGIVCIVAPLPLVGTCCGLATVCDSATGPRCLGKHRLVPQPGAALDVVDRRVRDSSSVPGLACRYLFRVEPFLCENASAGFGVVVLVDTSARHVWGVGTANPLL